ncbi:MAG: 3'(2'),5'-bisphosphate nucleotidase CysQ [Micromonosporaceae bacterium]
MPSRETAAPETVPDSDAGLAAWLAERAGGLLLRLRTELGFGDPAALRDAGDKQSHELLMAAFATWRPGDAVLSEEGVDDKVRLAADRVWIVDPLDGTREYGEEGRTDWAVHVALWQRGHGLVAGAVALPAQGQVLSTDVPELAAATPGPGAATPGPDAATPGPGAAAPAGTDRPWRIATSRTRPPGFLPETARELGAELVPMGSAGAKVCAVVQGTVDAYVHAGGQYEWDSAAPVAVALATGHYASRLDGSTLEYNQPDPRLPDLVVCRPELAPRLLAALNAGDKQ